jgi:hypothetical protein
MKNAVAMSILVFALVLAVSAQDKPRVFVQGKGSENLANNGSAAGGRHWATWGSKSTFDSHDESMEVTKDLQKNCSTVTVTLNQSNADYTIMLNRESKQNRGLLRANSQVQVANRDGDILGTSSTRTVGNAAKDACELILADWRAHGRTGAPTSGASAGAPTPARSQSLADQPQPESGVQAQQIVSQAVKPDQPQPVVTASSTSGSTTTGASDQSVGEAARQAKQHKACLELAKDNPSIVCK